MSVRLVGNDGSVVTWCAPDEAFDDTHGSTSIFVAAVDVAAAAALRSMVDELCGGVVTASFTESVDADVAAALLGAP